MERYHFAIDCLCVRLVGNLPTAVRSPSKLASIKGVRSSLGVKVHHMPVNGCGVGIVGDDAIAEIALYDVHFHLLLLYLTITLGLVLWLYNRFLDKIG